MNKPPFAAGARFHGRAGASAAVPGLPPGTLLRGKWTGVQIQVERALGSGANGQVYLVRTPKGKAAMKVCPHAADVALEWGLLSQLSGRTDVLPKPMLADDEAGGEHRFFYIMEWIPGSPLDQLLRQGGDAVWCELLAAAAEGLASMHRLGHAFSDVKPENILVPAEGKTLVRFVDVGGVTPFGRSVRQFTLHYDRAFWGLGSRRAEPGYDVAALALLAVCTLVPPPRQLAVAPVEERRRWLEQGVRKVPWPTVANALAAALGGQLQEASELARLLRERACAAKPVTRARPAAVQQGLHRSPAAGHGGTQTLSAPAGGVPASAPPRADWTERLMWVSLAMAAASAVAAWLAVAGML
ncbi:MAG: phosphotransferase [Alicyclobacillaceae bacterium]|nr:phosphotransferase [Alicyclobacillaceae bacterium]